MKSKTSLSYLTLIIIFGVIFLSGCPGKITVNECMSNSSCNENMKCLNGECVNIIVKDCEDNSQCNEGEICSQGKCINQFQENICETDADCEAEHYCESTIGKCVKDVSNDPCEKIECEEGNELDPETCDCIDINEDLPCLNDSDCMVGQYCNSSIGICRGDTLDDSCLEGVCADGYFCNLETGNCELVDDLDPCEYTRCAEGYECDTEAGNCVLIEENINPCEYTMCAEGYECDTETGNCELIEENINPCEYTMCASGYECDAETGNCILTREPDYETFMCKEQPLVCGDVFLCFSNCDADDEDCGQHCFDSASEDCITCIIDASNCLEASGCIDEDDRLMGNCVYDSECNNEQTLNCLGNVYFIEYKEECSNSQICVPAYNKPALCFEEDGSIPENSIPCNISDLCSCPSDMFCNDIGNGNGFCQTACADLME